MTCFISEKHATLSGPTLLPRPFNVVGLPSSSYPYPLFDLEGGEQEFDIRLVSLGNDQFDANFVIDLGGKLRGYKTPNSVGVATTKGIVVKDGDVRWPAIVDWVCNDASLGRMAPVTYAMVEPEEEGDPAVLILSGEDLRLNLFWQVAISVQEGQVGLGAEMQLYNTGWKAMPVSFGPQISSRPNDTSITGAYLVETTVQPGQMISKVFNLEFGVKDKVFPQPEKDIQPQSTALTLAFETFARGDMPQFPEVSLTAGLTSQSHALRAYMLVAVKEFGAALHESSKALELNTLDHRMWWLQAVCQRYLGYDDEREGLLQGHHLWPSDPLLRVEAYLSTPTSGSREANPLLAPFKSDPGGLVEAASMLCLLHLDQDLSRLADESFRHRNVAMVRYLLAYALLSRTRFEAEAAGHVGAAAKLGVGPPFPSRPIELTALRALNKRFPQDQTLAEYLRLAEWAGIA